MQDIKWVVPYTMCEQKRRPTVEDFARIRLGESRVVSNDGAIVTVQELDSDSRGLFFIGICHDHTRESRCVSPRQGDECEVRMLDVAEVRP